MHSSGGDIVFIVKQKPHSKFKRRGADLVTIQGITLEEALTGGKITIDYMCGKKITLVIEPGRIVNPNEILYIDNLGLPRYKGHGNGRLYVLVAVKLPIGLQKQTYDKLMNVFNIKYDYLIRL